MTKCNCGGTVIGWIEQPRSALQAATDDRRPPPEPTHHTANRFDKHLGTCPICWRTFDTIEAATAHRDERGSCTDPANIPDLIDVGGVWTLGSTASRNGRPQLAGSL